MTPPWKHPQERSLPMCLPPAPPHAPIILAPPLLSLRHQVSFPSGLCSSGSIGLEAPTPSFSQSVYSQLLITYENIKWHLLPTNFTLNIIILFGHRSCSLFTSHVDYSLSRPSYHTNVYVLKPTLGVCKDTEHIQIGLRGKGFSGEWGAGEKGPISSSSWISSYGMLCYFNFMINYMILCKI